MKKTLFTLAITLLAMAAQAQIKLHDDGQVSLASLTKTYGVQVQPNGFTSFRIRSTSDWAWVNLSYSNAPKQKHWIVSNLADDTNPGINTFFVTGDGCVYRQGSWRAANDNEAERIEDAGAILDQITGYWYVPEDEGGKDRVKEENRRPGVSAQQVKEVLPEVITTDDSGAFYVDYEAFTVFLIEALKDQRREIELFRKTLEDNGMMELKKP